MNLELEILKQLEAAHPRKLKKRVLYAELELELSDLTRTEFERKLKVLEGKGQVRIYVGEDVTRLVITTDGLDRLADAR